MALMGATEYRGLMESQGDRDYRVSSICMHSMNEICFPSSLANLRLFNNDKTFFLKTTAIVLDKVAILLCSILPCLLGQFRTILIVQSIVQNDIFLAPSETGMHNANEENIVK